ncbi:zinc finger protein 267 [Manduca sexta]|uniref:zinc finger protein 267 n=1 Tax=Manduca sexta TaxID=7130 RepID=UPI00188E3BC0|nr:zinc finger protein 267 [Manduca sexta]
MVCYCCVKGCKNNTNIKKKDPNYMVSFHAFPTNPELRIKWLRAIGRPKWDPPSHTRICSVHFNYDQITHESSRNRIKDDAYPVNGLPPNSNFEATDLEVCRICLATDVNMNSLQQGVLKSCMESIGGLNVSETHNIEGLPQFVCNECAAHLKRFYSIVEKSIIAQASLLDIFAQHGEITKSLIQGLDRKQLNLVSSLNYYKQTNIYEFKYNYENETPSDVKSGSNTTDECKTNTQAKDYNIFVDEIFYEPAAEDVGLECINPNLIMKSKDEIEANNDKTDEIEVAVSSAQILGNIENYDDNATFWEDCDEDPVIIYKQNNRCQRKPEKKKLKIKRDDGLTPDEVDMQDHFDIVKLSLQEQIDEWKISVTKRCLNSETKYRCEICTKTFAHINTYNMHSSSHDPKRGKAECPVCKLRFKNSVIAKSHRNRMHGKKFYCKECPNVFNNVAMAKRHHRWHIGHVYICAGCPFTTMHESSLRLHVRTAHARDITCITCGRACMTSRGLMLHHATAHRDREKTDGNPAFSCEQCHINFESEGARRVHILTSSQHRQKPDLCDPVPVDPSLKKTCSKCGVECSSLLELMEHTRAEHRRPAQKKTSWSLPGDMYPVQCEHCGEMVNNRKEHWQHIRKMHPKETHTYQPVITMICDTCGKGFQNSTKLHLHELRHEGPRVACGSCPRVFYDKYALARHASMHAAVPRPHACSTCGRAFRLRTNLLRHARVHTSVRAYECTLCGKKFKYSTGVKLHVRTVHHKLPHPPRKKRSRAKKMSSAPNNENN